MTDYSLVEDWNMVENCDELLDDRHTESFTFVRDDAGEWWARSNVEGRGFTEARWWYVKGATPDELDGILETARKMAQ